MVPVSMELQERFLINFMKNIFKVMLYTPVAFFKKYKCLPLLAVGIFFGCKNQENKVERNARKTPSIYKLDFDPAFVYKQDTLYFKGKKFSGKKYLLYPNKDSVFVKSFLNGLEEGIQKRWYPNHFLVEERLYINGKKEGTHRGWWGNGKPKYIYHFNNDEYHGEIKEWYEDGQLFKVFHYVMGHEDGSERLWYQDGTVRANYVIKDGKKYGLIGIKLCKNPYVSNLKI